MRKTPTPKKTTKKTAAAPAQTDAKQVIFVTFHVGSANAVVKTPVATLEEGKKILDQANKAIVGEKPFYDKERGILIRAYELQMAYLSSGQVA